MKALILAGGRGSRLNKLTEDKNKSMLKLFEKPLIEYNLNHAVMLKVKEIIIVVGYKKEEIIRHIGKEYRGIKVSYVVQPKPRGVVNAIECARESLGSDDFVLMLADEIVPEARLKEMHSQFIKKNLFVLCGVVFENDKSSISKTYAAMVNEMGRVFRLIEKPRFPINKIKGTGHCFLKNEMLDYIERTPINANRGERELVDWIQCAVDEGKNVFVYKISEGYVNINTEDDFNLAKKLLMNKNPQVLLVHPQMSYFGGAELLLVELCNWLTKKGIKNDILTSSISEDAKKMLINTKIIIPKNSINISAKGFESIKDILNFIKVFRKELIKVRKNYDVINFHNFPATWTLFPYRKPSVWMLNEPPNLWSRPDAGIHLKLLNKIRIWMDKFIVKNSIDIICVADKFNQERCFERYGQNSRIVYYGVNYDFFSKGKSAQAQKRWNLKNRFVIAQSGVLSEVKNQLESLKTLKNIKDKIPNVLLVLAGKPEEEYKVRLDAYVKANKLEKYVLFTGNLNREDLRDVYATCNVGLFPVGKQGGWLAPFELLCSGKPLVVSEELGAASVIKKFNLGTVTRDYAKAILDVHKNYNEYGKKARNAARFVEKNLGWNVFTDKMIRAYKDAWRKH